ncbi:MAG: PIN domain-containing protein [Acidobacteriota bacterium]|nr:PIN domain-containing protein [Acidobacteriota bacterium]
MIVVDTGALVALLDTDEAHHDEVRAIYDENPDAWLLPWAILPEVDYLVATHLGPKAQEAFMADLSSGAFSVEWGREADLTRAEQIQARHRALRMGLVDAIVIATAERLKASAIVTLDLRHFGAVAIKGNPKLLPRDG